MPASLAGWLAELESRHPRGAAGIELGLERVAEVSRRLGQRVPCPLILVGGTNGKGSVCAMLERILRCAGYRTGLYTSPHLIRYNERVRIDGAPADDAALCAGFEVVERQRGDIALTYFELGTLAAWETLNAMRPDAIILEVGLGGRLDATNIYEPDCSIVTTVDLDHMDYLGGTREEIGFEKAGIFRAGRPAICGDDRPPASLVSHAHAIGADLQCLSRDFGYRVQERQWQYEGRGGRRSGLAFPALRGGYQLANASCVLAALDAVREALPVSMQDIRRGLLEVDLAGRCQVIPGRPGIVLDVAHNPQAAAALASSLGGMGFSRETWAVFGCMADKDIDGIVAALGPRVTRWLPCTLEGRRAAGADFLAERLSVAGAMVAGHYESVRAGLDAAQGAAGDDDRIIAFGSFLTVAAALQALGRAA